MKLDEKDSRPINVNNLENNLHAAKNYTEFPDEVHNSLDISARVRFAHFR